MPRVLHFNSLPSIAFVIVGIGNVAALWFNLYRLATLAFIIAIFIAQFSSSKRVVSAFGVVNALVKFAPIYIYVLLSTLWSPDPSDALVNALYMCAAVTPAIVLGAVLASRYNALDIAQGLAALLLPFAVQAFISACEGGGSMEVGEGTMRSLLGGILCLVSPIIAGAWALTHKKRFLLCGLIAIVFVVSMESRSVVLFAVPAAILSLLMQDKKLGVRALLVCLLGLVAVLAFSEAGMFSRFQSNSTSFEVGESVLNDFSLPVEQRVDFDRRLTTFTASQAFFKSPFFGEGFWAVSQVHRLEYGMDLSAHGLIPGTLGELGLVGILIFIVLVWQAIASAIRRFNYDPTADPMIISFAIGVLALLLLGIFHQTIESPFFALALALLIGLGHSSVRHGTALVQKGVISAVH